MADFEVRLKQYQDTIEAYLSEKCFIYPQEPQQTLFEAMRYSLLAGGKRLRPVMVYDFCRMCGGKWEDAAAFGAAIEMIHTYSLIHDDLPAMDNDDLRRGRPTNHKVYGEATAILAGDALLTAAFGQLAKAPYDAEAKVRAVSVLAECAGEQGMVGGQVLDIASEERACTEQEILDIQYRKTSALIRAACVLGVIAGGGTPEQEEAAAVFANHLGLAFQIRDDVLDQIGDAKVLGKAVGTDEGKNTFLHLYGMDACEQLVEKHTEMAISTLNAFESNEWMTELALSLTKRTY